MDEGIHQLAVGYCRVSTGRQGETGYGLEAQRHSILSEVERRDWNMGEFYVDVGSGGSMRGRTQLQEVLSLLDEGSAHILIVAKLDRLSRSVPDFANLIARSRKFGWSIVALDIGVDTSTANGELVAHIIMALAQWERRIIGQRTKDALEVVRESGVKLGRPITLDPGTVTTIKLLRSADQSFQKIANALNSQGVPTAQGGEKWHASSVRVVFKRIEKADEVYKELEPLITSEMQSQAKEREWREFSAGLRTVPTGP